MRIDRLQQAFNVRLKWTHFPLHPETPSEGKALSELFAGRDIDLDAMYERMKGLMDAEGLEYGQRTHTYNSRLAQELAIWADDFPEADALHAAMYRAYFEVAPYAIPVYGFTNLAPPEPGLLNPHLALPIIITGSEYCVWLDYSSGSQPRVAAMKRDLPTFYTVRYEVTFRSFTAFATALFGTEKVMAWEAAANRK